MVEDQPMEPVEWVYPMAQELENWTAEAPNTENFRQINKADLALDDVDKSSRKDEEEETEEEALNELERLLEQERPKLQSGTKELEIINLDKGGETREIHIGKLILSDFKQRLTELLKEYEDIFAWSYRDMPGLDTAIIEHRLPLIPNAIPIRQELRRMKPEVALKIKVEKQWKWQNTPSGWPTSCQSPRRMGKCKCMLIIGISIGRAQRIIFLYPTLTYWWITLLNTLVIPSWMDSLGTTKSRWPLRISSKPLSSPRGEHSVIRSCHSDSKMLGQPIRGPWSPSSMT
ncbi:hypothetical protein CR513_24685, partial [Mucuna pruriens]